MASTARGGGSQDQMPKRTPVSGVGSASRNAKMELPRPRRFLSEAQVAAILFTTVRGMRQWPKKDRPPFIEIRPRLRIYDEEAFYAWLETRPRGQ